MLQLTLVNFKPNSYIFVEGTPSEDRFYIIKSGNVRTYQEMAIPGGKTGAVLGPGDFVGVIACMSGHPQIENVVCMTDVVAIMIKRSQFPDLIAKNTPVAFKIIKAFSLAMRQGNDTLARLTTNSSSYESPEAIFKIAKYFDDQRNKDAAAYGYYQYIKYCPYGTNVKEASRRYSDCSKGSHAVYLEPSDEMVRSYPSQTMIFSECQPGNDMFVITEGQVKISKIVNDQEITLAILKNGDMFGEMALLDNRPRSATAMAMTDTVVTIINRKNFDQMVQTQPQLISRLTTILSERMWAIYRQLINTQLKETREKLIDMLAIQIEKQKIPYGKGQSLQTSYSPGDIINLCGISPQNFSEAERLLSIDQNVKINFGKITIPDVGNLIRQAEFYRKQNSKHNN